MKRYAIPAILTLLLINLSQFIVGCWEKPMMEVMPPTPTPIQGGSIFFKPLRMSSETKAIEVLIVNVSKRVPNIESSTIITEPATLQEITTILVNAVSAPPAGNLPSVRQKSGYLIDLGFYSRDDILPLSSTSGQWMLTNVVYEYANGFIVINLPDVREGRKIERYTVSPALREILEQALVRQGLALPP